MGRVAAALAVPAGADDVVLQVSSGGGYVPEIVSLAEFPVRPAIGTETRCSET